jgi:flagellar motor switch protein FliM
MESNWTRALLGSDHKLQGASGDLLRSSHELLARELALSLSAFLRSTVAVVHTGGEELAFGDLQKAESPSSAGAALVRPGAHQLLIELQHSVLFPLIGIALGAKPGSFGTPERKPTDIELQVVNIVFRLILSETYRAWEPLVKAHLETVALEIERASSQPFQSTDPVFVARFNLTVGDHAGLLSLVVPPDLFARALIAEEPAHREKPGSNDSSVEGTLQLMLPAKVSVDVWLDGSQMQLQDLLQLREGQIVTLDHPVERKAICTLNGKTGYTGQIVSTGSRRAFLIEETSPARS